MTYIAFDIDGTLFDCEEIIVEAFQKGINRFRMEESRDIEIPTKETIMTVIGIPNQQIYRALFPNLNRDELQKINNFCSLILTEMIVNGGGRIYDSVYSTLESLYKKGNTLFIASNGRLEYIEAILNSKGIMKFFSKPIIHIDNEIKDKIDIIRCYKKMIPEDNLLIMIGDRESDRIAARENNIPFIGCIYGHVGGKEVEGVRWIVREFAEIPERIQEIKYSVS